MPSIQAAALATVAWADETRCEPEESNQVNAVSIARITVDSVTTATRRRRSD